MLVWYLNGQILVKQVHIKQFFLAQSPVIMLLLGCMHCKRIQPWVYFLSLCNIPRFIVLIWRQQYVNKEAATVKMTHKSPIKDMSQMSI